MRKIPGIFLLILMLTVFFLACRKGQVLVRRPAYIKFNLDVFITDTAVYNSVRLHNIAYDLTLSDKDQIINGTYATIVTEGAGIEKPPSNEVRLNVSVIKTNHPNLLFNELVTIDNVNDFLLLQIDPNKAAVLINKLTESSRYIQPGKDSIKARFFFNDADRIFNPNNNSKVTLVDLQLYKESTKANGNMYAEKDTLIKGIKINELSNYFSFKENTIYGFDMLDGNAALPNNKKLIQKFKFIPFEHFTIGRIDLSSGKFQTIRLQKANGTFIGQYLFSFK